MKKIFALVLAMMMVVGMTAALAADGDPADAAITATNNSDGTHWAGDTQYDTTWRGTNDTSLTIRGLEPGDTVNFYRVLEYDQTADKTVSNAEAITTNGTDWHAAGWKLVSPFNTGANALTVEEFKEMLTSGISSTLAGKIAKSATGTATIPDVVANGNAGAAEATTTLTAAQAGLYVALITPANAGVVYNPVFVASDYYTTTSGDKSSDWTVDLDDSYANVAMAKKSEITLDKEAAEETQTENEKQGEGTNKVDDAKAVAVGDVIDFTVKTTIPEFANNYLNPLFVITDLLDSGLALNQGSIEVHAATVSGDTWTIGAKIDEGDTTFAISDKSATGYKITFKPQYLLNLSAAQPIMVTYKASITDEAVTSVREKDNTVTLEYSHKPDVDQEGEGKKLRDKTHHYTFTIDGEIWGNSSYHSTEIVKIGLDKNGEEIWSDPQTLDSGNKIGALEGAEFKLYTDANCTQEYSKGAYGAAAPNDNGNKILSDAKGRLYIIGQTDHHGISGLDAGTYYLREEKAPAGYIKQQAPVKIEIIPTYFDSYTFTEDGFTITCDDVLQSYVVEIDDAKTAEYVFTYPEPNANGVRSSDDPTAIAGTGNDQHGDIYIGNTGPITEKETEKQPTDDDGKIKNTQGVELPSTGGVGTTIFYIAGSILVLAAVIFLVTKRRMNANND